MIDASLLHAGELAAGFALSFRLWTLRPQSVEQMVARLDMPLAVRVAEMLATDQFDIKDFRSLCVFKLHSQAVLLTRIALTLAKQYPDEYASLPAELKQNLGLLRCAAIMCMFELLWRKLPWTAACSTLNARECAIRFSRIFNLAENLIVRFDSPGYCV